MPRKKDSKVKERALHLYLTMSKVKLNQIAIETGVDVDLLKQWRSEEDWPTLRAKHRASERKRQVRLATKERYERVLHSCDVILRLLTRDLNRFGREVQPDQHQMVRLMRIIRDINEMAGNAMRDLRALEEQDDAH